MFSGDASSAGIHTVTGIFNNVIFQPADDTDVELSGVDTQVGLARTGTNTFTSIKGNSVLLTANSDAIANNVGDLYGYSALYDYVGVSTYSSAYLFHGEYNAASQSALTGERRGVWISGATHNQLSGNLSVDSVNVSGVSTLGITTVTDLTGQQLNVSGVSTFQGSINLGDSHRLKFGDEGNGTLQIYHTSGGSALISYTGGGDLSIRNAGDDRDILIRSDDGSGGYADYFRADGSTGEVKLYHYGTQKFATKSTGIEVTGTTDTDTLNVSGVSTFQGNVNLGDNDQIIIGDGSDLKLYHDGSNSYVEDAGVGALIMKGSTIRFRSTTNENIINASQNGEVDLYYDGAKKFETTSSGAKVTGDLEVTGVLSYDDVTNVDSVGIVTARSGIHVTGGNVGIGTNNPNRKLVVEGSGNTFSSIKAGTSDDVGLIFGDTDNDARGLVRYSNAGDALSLWTAGTEKFRIRSDGKVGINESSNINGRLHIQHDALNENILYATRYNDQSNDKPIFAVTEATMSGMTSPGLIIGNHNRDIHIGQVFNDAAGIYSSDTTGIRITSAGKVGIGTDNPTEKLDVNGAIRLRANNQTTYAAALKANYDSSHVLSLEAYHNSNSAFEVIGTHADSGGGNVRVAIAKDGQKVGIGTDNPLQKLHIVDNTSANIYLETKNSSTGSTSGIYFRTSDSSTQDAFFKTAIVLEDDNTTFARGKLHILQENSDDNSNATLSDSVVTIDQSGKVGIGTDNPSVKLDVGGDINFNANVLISSFASSSNIDHIWHDDSASFGKDGTWNFVSDSTRKATGNSAIQIGYLKSSGGGHFLDSVGIGTTNPQEKLHVLGTSSDFVVDTDSSVLRFGSYGEYDIALVTGRNTSTGSSRVYIENGDGEALRIASNGNVGIGTNSPDTLLNLFGTGNTTIKVHNNSATAGTYSKATTYNWRTRIICQV